MKATVSQPNLLKASQGIGTLIPTRASLPVLSMALLQVGNEKLKVTGTDLDSFLTLSLEASSDSEGSALVPFKKFKQLIAAFPKAPIHIEQGENGVEIASGNGKYTLNSIPVVEFPTVPIVDDDTFPVPLSDIIARVGFAATTEDSRPILQGIYFDTEPNGRLTIVATNGHRLARLSVSNVDDPDCRDSFIVPAKSLKPCAKWDDVQASSNGTHTAFTAEGRELIVRNIDGPYPNYAQVWPGPATKTLTLDRATLIASVKRLSVMASDITHRVRLECSTAAGGTLSATTPDLETATETLPSRYAGDEISIGLNAIYVLEVLTRLTGDEVCISMTGEDRATVWDSPSDPDYACLIMPLRLLD